VSGKFCTRSATAKSNRPFTKKKGRKKGNHQEATHGVAADIVYSIVYKDVVYTIKALGDPQCCSLVHDTELYRYCQAIDLPVDKLPSQLRALSAEDLQKQLATVQRHLAYAWAELIA
jgi:hypothetical protein